MEVKVQLILLIRVLSVRINSLHGEKQSRRSRGGAGMAQ